jgi:transposase
MVFDATNLPNSIDELKGLLVRAQEENLLLQQKVDNLTLQINLYLQQRYGKRSDAVNPSQLCLFNEAETTDVEVSLKEEESADVIVKEHIRRTSGRAAIPAHLPRVDIVLDIPESDRRCADPTCGHDLKKIGEEVSEKLDIIPAKIQVLRYIRPKYACPCCSNGVRTTPMPKLPLPKSNASAGMLAHIAVSKYMDALPLYRQEAILSRFGVELGRATTARWMIECGKLVIPLINLMREKLLESPVINADETPIQVLNEPNRSPESKSWMWVQVRGSPGERVILFEYNSSRSQAVPADLLAGYKGYLQVDGYDGYKRISMTNGVARVGCWAHVRRKFTDALKAGVKGAQGTVAGEAVSRIAKLYAIEKAVRDSACEARQAARQQQAKPILDELRQWLENSMVMVPPKTPTGKALAYMNNEWTYLIRYIEHGDLGIDNNVAERAIRPFTIGRKNWIFSDSVAGADASAALYSIIETAKANNAALASAI